MIGFVRDEEVGLGAQGGVGGSEGPMGRAVFDVDGVGKVLSKGAEIEPFPPGGEEGHLTSRWISEFCGSAVGAQILLHRRQNRGPSVPSGGLPYVARETRNLFPMS